MAQIMDYPIIVLMVSIVVMWLSVRSGAACHRRWNLSEDRREDFRVIQGATLTLLGLIIGFTFSMALTRYDQRKNYEEAEANAIGTEYVRADLLSAAGADRVRVLLRNYLQQRILFYKSRDAHELQQINADTAKLQSGLWSAVQTSTAPQPTPLTALAVAGMNDVLNSQGYTQSAWWNRIPPAAFGMMGIIAICCNLLIGYGGQRAGANTILYLVLPVVLSIAFLLIADIDSPRGGIIRVHPQNLESLFQSLLAP
jgi:hypothetical protein